MDKEMDKERGDLEKNREQLLAQRVLLNQQPATKQRSQGLTRIRNHLREINRSLNHKDRAQHRLDNNERKGKWRERQRQLTTMSHHQTPSQPRRTPGSEPTPIQTVVRVGGSKDNGALVDTAFFSRQQASTPMPIAIPRQQASTPMRIASPRQQAPTPMPIAIPDNLSAEHLEFVRLQTIAMRQQNLTSMTPQQQLAYIRMESVRDLAGTQVILATELQAPLTNNTEGGRDDISRNFIRPPTTRTTPTACTTPMPSNNNGTAPSNDTEISGNFGGPPMPPTTPTPANNAEDEDGSQAKYQTVVSGNFGAPPMPRTTPTPANNAEDEDGSQAKDHPALTGNLRLTPRTPTTPGTHTPKPGNNNGTERSNADEEEDIGKFGTTCTPLEKDVGNALLPQASQMQESPSQQPDVAKFKLAHRQQALLLLLLKLLDIAYDETANIDSLAWVVMQHQLFSENDFHGFESSMLLDNQTYYGAFQNKIFRENFLAIVDYVRMHFCSIHERGLTFRDIVQKVRAHSPTQSKPKRNESELVETQEVHHEPLEPFELNRMSHHPKAKSDVDKTPKIPCLPTGSLVKRCKLYVPEKKSLSPIEHFVQGQLDWSASRVSVLDGYFDRNLSVSVLDINISVSRVLLQRWDKMTSMVNTIEDDLHNLEDHLQDPLAGEDLQARDIQHLRYQLSCRAVQEDLSSKDLRALRGVHFAKDLQGILSKEGLETLQKQLSSSNDLLATWFRNNYLARIEYLQALKKQLDEEGTVQFLQKIQLQISIANGKEQQHYRLRKAVNNDPKIVRQALPYKQKEQSIKDLEQCSHGELYAQLCGPKKPHMIITDPLQLSVVILDDAVELYVNPMRVSDDDIPLLESDLFQICGLVHFVVVDWDNKPIKIFWQETASKQAAEFILNRLNAALAKSGLAGFDGSDNGSCGSEAESDGDDSVDEDEGDNRVPCINCSFTGDEGFPLCLSADQIRDIRPKNRGLRIKQAVLSESQQTSLASACYKVILENCTLEDQGTALVRALLDLEGAPNLRELKLCGKNPFGDSLLVELIQGLNDATGQPHLFFDVECTKDLINRSPEASKLLGHKIVEQCVDSPGVSTLLWLCLDAEDGVDGAYEPLLAFLKTYLEPALRLGTNAQRANMKQFLPRQSSEPLRDLPFCLVRESSQQKLQRDLKAGLKGVLRVRHEEETAAGDEGNMATNEETAPTDQQAAAQGLVSLGWEGTACHAQLVRAKAEWKCLVCSTSNPLSTEICGVCESKRGAKGVYSGGKGAENAASQILAANESTAGTGLGVSSSQTTESTTGTGLCEFKTEQPTLPSGQFGFYPVTGQPNMDQPTLPSGREAKFGFYPGTAQPSMDQPTLPAAVSINASAASTFKSSTIEPTTTIGPNADPISFSFPRSTEQPNSTARKFPLGFSFGVSQTSAGQPTFATLNNVEDTKEPSKQDAEGKVVAKVDIENLDIADKDAEESSTKDVTVQVVVEADMESLAPPTTTPEVPSLAAAPPFVPFNGDLDTLNYGEPLLVNGEPAMMAGLNRRQKIKVEYNDGRVLFVSPSDQDIQVRRWE